MNYVNDERGGVCGCEPMPPENLTDMLKDTAGLAANVRIGAARIRAHLFGQDQTPCNGDTPEKKIACFQGDLGEMRVQLRVASETLAEIAALLGVR